MAARITISDSKIPMVKYTALLYTLVSLWDIHFPRGSLIKPLDSVQHFTETHITDQSLKQVGIDQTCQCSPHTASASMPVGCPQTYPTGAKGTDLLQSSQSPAPRCRSLCQPGCFQVHACPSHRRSAVASQCCRGLRLSRCTHLPHPGGRPRSLPGDLPCRRVGG